MVKVGNIISLYISDRETSLSIEKKEITVDKKGIVNDKHYNKNIERSILIVSLASYDLLKKNHINVPYGFLGENLLIDYNPYLLPIGTKIQIGKIILEISQNCTLCNHLSEIDKRIPTLLKKDRGIFTRVVESGSIEVKDKIFLLDSE